MDRRALLLAALLLLPLATAPAHACGVPCGRIYPLIILTVDEQATMWNLTQGASEEIAATLTFQFDMVNEGYTAASPNEPVIIRFEYPRKPDWIDIKVEPEAIEVPVNNPVYAKPDLADPTNPQGSYVFTAPLTITLALNGAQPVLKDGYDFAKLLVFAKSSESGLYQSGYGIKELRAIPAGALHEADVAGSRDVFTAVPLPALALESGSASFGGTTVTFTPPASAKFWEPAEFRAAIDPVPTGRVVFALHDEEGALVASTPPTAAPGGEIALTATLAKPGRHTASVTLLPEPGGATPPLTYAIPFDAGALDAEGFTYPKTYALTATERVPAPLASTADALAQFERDIPFFIFDTAQSVTATVTLVGEAPADLGRSLANLQFSLHDPDGNMLQAGSVDPTKPAWSLRVGSVPVDGWYVLRVKGVGAPVASRYDASIEVNYAAAHSARNRADGAPDITGGLLTLGGRNLTLPADALAVWTPSDITPVVDGAAAATYSLTVYDANGTLAYASGARSGPASFSAPAPGTYRAFAFAEPALRGVPFAPVVRAFTFQVGAGNTTVASTFRVEDGYEAPVAPGPTLLGYHLVRVLAGAGAPSIEGAELVEAEGAPADGSAPGDHWLRASGQGQPPTGSEVPVTLEIAYAQPVTMEGPGAPAPPAGGLPIPGLAIALLVAALGALAVGAALWRR